MGNDRWMESCERCGKEIDVGLFTRRPYYCAICEIEAASDPEAAPELGALSVGDKLPKPEEMPAADTPAKPESEVARQKRYTREDHNWAMGQKPDETS
ncbi:MAG: hypothetical protein SWH61_10730 [Thermodesulfobacteriota bacterium]|nr:hypothetical protein [Thermodesulfobacteriota bacterium]